MAIPSKMLADVFVAADSTAALADMSSAWPTYVGKMPPNLLQGILFTDTGGASPEVRMLIDYPTVSVLIRAKQYDTAYNKAKDVKDFLHRLNPQTVSGDLIASCVMSSDIISVGYDTEDFVMMSLNFALIIEPAINVNTNREDI